jgi:hypothetical protein
MADHNPYGLPWWRGLLLQSDGRFSVASAQSVFGALISYGAMLTSAFAKEPSILGSRLGPALVIGAIIWVAGAVARILEVRLVRLPVRLPGLIAQCALTSEERDNSVTSNGGANGTDPVQSCRRSQRFWSLAGEQGTPDIAVLQLCIGAVIVPVLSFFPASAPVAWRMVAVTVLSEVVYLAFLVARLIRLSELDDLAQAIEETQQQIQQRSEAREVPKVELKMLQQTQGALFARADVLWRQIGFMFDDADDNKSPGGDQQQAHVAEAPKPNI